MKAIQITMDPELLTLLDAQEEVKRKGRSSVIRSAVEAWLRSTREQQIVQEYQRAYGEGGGLGGEWDGWEEEGTWLEE
ncbi:MAG: hypothetical protein ABI333_05295 [bacterium]